MENGPSGIYTSCNKIRSIILDDLDCVEWSRQQQKLDEDLSAAVVIYNSRSCHTFPRSVARWESLTFISNVLILPQQASIVENCIADSFVAIGHKTH